MASELTHSFQSGVTLSSTSTGVTLYNTADQTTNYERVLHYWSGNTYTILSSNGGTGTVRPISIAAGSSTITLANTTTPIILSRTALSSAGASIVTANGGLSASSGVQSALTLAPTLTQTSTAGYTALLVNPTETTTGSGAKLLADFQVGSSSKASIDNTGKITTAADTIRVSTAKTPASATAAGSAGDIAWDANYVYVCTATNTWKRSAIATW
jgi:hypothetical protein